MCFINRIVGAETLTDSLREICLGKERAVHDECVKSLVFLFILASFDAILTFWFSKWSRCQVSEGKP